MVTTKEIGKEFKLLEGQNMLDILSMGMLLKIPSQKNGLCISVSKYKTE
jgi:hypothetical protein